MVISILGTGSMGSAIAEHLLKNNEKVVVYNRNEKRAVPLQKKGALLARTPFEAIEKSDVAIFAMLDGKAVKESILTQKKFDSMKNKIIINTSTSTQEETQEISKLVQENGGIFGEVAMLADPNSLRDGSAVLDLGCNEEDTREIKDILLKFSATVNRVGKLGDVSALTTISLINSWLSIASLAYSVAVSQKMDISSEAYSKILENSSSLAPYYVPNMVAHNYDMVYGSVNGNLSMGETLIKLVQKLNLPADIFVDTQNLLKAASNSGYGDKDSSAVLEAIINSK